jgi:hypothetical protein
MNLSLDIALYHRDQTIDNSISPNELGVLHTLAQRIGNNTFAWISHETLAIELKISQRQLARYMSKLRAKGLIETPKDPKDKRKNLYRLASFLINYHQKEKSVSMEQHTSTLIYKNKNTSHNRLVDKEKYMTHMSGNNNQRQICQVNSRHICQELSDAQVSQPIENSIKKTPAHFPKVKEESNNKDICASIDAQTSFETFWKNYPRKKDRARAERVWLKNKLDKKATEIMKKLQEQKTQWKDEKYIPYPKTYLENNRWEDEVTEKSFLPIQATYAQPSLSRYKDFECVKKETEMQRLADREKYKGRTAYEILCQR